MSTVLELDDLRSGYVKVVKEVLNKGREVSPRGLRTLELSPVMLVIRDPSKVIPVGVGRNLRLEIGAAESTQLIGGVSDAAQMVSITRNFAQFVEEGRLRGAYGPRAAAQFPRVIDLIGRDGDTRQAGVVIWRPWDLARPSKDVPCTIELHFALRGGRLDIHVFMRSNDVFWGLPYDAWMFSNVQHAVAYALGVEVGTYYHTANSLHAYVDKDLGSLNALHEYDMSGGPPMFPPTGEPGDAGPAARWARISSWARAAMGLGGSGDEEGVFPATVSWYRNALVPYWSGGLLCPACRYVLPKTDEHFCFAGGRARANRLVCRSCKTLRERGLAPDDYESLLFEQEFTCGVCKERRPLVIDYDHEDSAAVRGLVCRACNFLLGAMDRSQFFDAAREYLDKAAVRAART